MEDDNDDDSGGQDGSVGAEIRNDCRCGECCRSLIIEVDLDDAQREPTIANRGRTIREFTGEVIGYLLNDRTDLACVFLDRQTNLCTIYETRPMVCRVFDCEGEGRQQLIELGILSESEGRAEEGSGRRE